MTHTIIHKLANGGVGNYPPSPKVLALMMGAGFGWDEARIASEASKFTIPSPDAGWAGFSAEFADAWCRAVGKGGLTETEAFELFTQRIQLRRGYTASAVIDDSDLPDEIKKDRYFRAAVVWDDAQSNKCNFDMPTARGIHLTEIRRVRNAELVKEDVNMLKAIEAEDASAQSTVATKKQVLRDLPATFDITTDAGTPELLKAKWPTELPARE